MAASWLPRSRMGLKSQMQPQIPQRVFQSQQQPASQSRSRCILTRAQGGSTVEIYTPQSAKDAVEKGLEVRQCLV